MPFWTSILRYVALEKLKGLGEATLAHGRRVFAEEVAAGKTHKQAARSAARAMTDHAVEQGRGAGRAVSGTASKVAGAAARRAGDAVRVVRCRAEDLGADLRTRLADRLPDLADGADDLRRRLLRRTRRK